MQEGDLPSDLSFSGSDIAIIGPIVDERGKAAVDYVSERSVQVLSLLYNPETFEVELDGSRINAEELEDLLKSYQGRFILEATTLGFVEIFLCCRALYSLGHSVLHLLYVEPVQYRNPRRSQLLHRRDFELSEEFAEYRAIPGATVMLTDRHPQRGVFFLGYEERRLDRALEDYQMIRPALCSVVFGVPAFRPGWEMDAFANNIRVIRDKNVKGGIHFCGAENPAAAFEVLLDIHAQLNPGEQMFVSPIGTKPCGIGAALFTSTYSEVGILYDHPKRRRGRSGGVSRWHLYEVQF